LMLVMITNRFKTLLISMMRRLKIDGADILERWESKRSLNKQIVQFSLAD
jgi:hypothetical protein